MLEGSLRIVRAHLSEAMQRLHELAQAKNALEEIKDVKVGEQSLIPMGAGNFIIGKVGDCSKVYVSVGGDVILRRSRVQAIKILESRISEKEKTISELALHENKLAQSLDELRKEIQSMQK